jgi:diphthamide synthase (EF-2-diphthine--ammonia ligase)
MNGYKMIAESYRRKIESGEMQETDAIQKKLKALEYVASCDQEDLFHLVNTSAFNSIIIQYLDESLRRANVSKETSDAVMNELMDLLSDSIFEIGF